MQSLKVFNPYDRSEIQSIPFDTAEQVENKLSSAFSRFRNFKTRIPKHERIALLQAAVTELTHRKEEFINIALSEGGKPRVDTVVEVDRAIHGIKIAIETLSHFEGKEVAMGLTAGSANRFAYTHREPYGIGVSVSAFNHPLNLIIHQTVPAFAVGAPVIVKPALTTPLSCINLVELFHSVGIPKDYIDYSVCENELAERMVTDRRVGYLSFIGSSKVGWYLKSKLAPGARCALEHGGAAPVILAPDADLDAAIAPLVKGGFYHAGQVCVSVQRIYVPKANLKSFVDKFTAKAQKLIVGNQNETSTEIGPIILPREVVRIHDWVTQAVSSGAELTCGGAPISDTCYPATVLVNPPEDSLVSKNEIFGPVVCIYGYEKLEEAYDRANGTDFSFQSSIFTQNIQIAYEAIQRLDAQTVLINDHTAFRVDWMPFGACSTSGLGLGGIPFTMEEMTRPKMAVWKL